MEGRGSVMQLDDHEIETLAKAYHERYRAETGGSSSGRSSSSPHDLPWDDLDDSTREANRASARAALEHVATMRLTPRRVRPGDTPEVLELEADRIEAAARREHIRWMQHTLALGVVHGDRRDDDADPPTHPDLVPWEDLSETDREKDRIRVRALPELLAAVGIELREDPR